MTTGDAVVRGIHAFKSFAGSIVLLDAPGVQDRQRVHLRHAGGELCGRVVRQGGPCWLALPDVALDPLLCAELEVRLGEPAPRAPRVPVFRLDVVLKGHRLELPSGELELVHAAGPRPPAADLCGELRNGERVIGEARVVGTRGRELKLVSNAPWREVSADTSVCLMPW